MNKSIIIIGITTTLFLSQAVVADKGKYRLQILPSFACGETCAGGSLTVSNNSDDTDACIRGPETIEYTRESGGLYLADWGNCNGHKQADDSHVEFIGEVYRDNIKCGTLTWPSNGDSYTWKDNGGETCKFAPSDKGTSNPYIHVEKPDDCNGGSGNCEIDIIINYTDF